jgi:hypothetical protein
MHLLPTANASITRTITSTHRHQAQLILNSNHRLEVRRKDGPTDVELDREEWLQKGANESSCMMLFHVVLSDCAAMINFHNVQIVVLAILAAVTRLMGVKPTLAYVRKESRMPRQENRVLMPEAEKSKSFSKE